MGWILQVGWGNFLCVSCLPWNLWEMIQFDEDLLLFCLEKKTPPARSDFWSCFKFGICQTGWHKRVAAILWMFWFQFTSIEKKSKSELVFEKVKYTPPEKMNWAVLIVMCKWATRWWFENQQRGCLWAPTSSHGTLKCPWFSGEDIYILYIHIWVVATQIFFMFTPTWEMMQCD